MRQKRSTAFKDSSVEKLETLVFLLGQLFWLQCTRCRCGSRAILNRDRNFNEWSVEVMTNALRIQSFVEMDGSLTALPQRHLDQYKCRPHDYSNNPFVPFITVTSFACASIGCFHIFHFAGLLRITV